MKKLCVVFPGRHYSCDRSLLYYPAEWMWHEGFDIRRLHYDVPRDETEIDLATSLQKAETDAAEQLKEIPFEDYEEIVFLSKSVGTEVASLAEKKWAPATIHQIYITPLEDSVPFMENKDLIICGDKDHFFPNAQKTLAAFQNTHIFPGLTHSLETEGDIRKTLDTVSEIVDIIAHYLDSLR